MQASGSNVVMDSFCEGIHLKTVLKVLKLSSNAFVVCNTLSPEVSSGSLIQSRPLRKRFRKIGMLSKSTESFCPEDIAQASPSKSTKLEINRGFRKHA